MECLLIWIRGNDFTNTFFSQYKTYADNYKDISATNLHHQNFHSNVLKTTKKLKRHKKMYSIPKQNIMLCKNYAELACHVFAGYSLAAWVKLAAYSLHDAANQ